MEEVHGMCFIVNCPEFLNFDWEACDGVIHAPTFDVTPIRPN